MLLNCQDNNPIKAQIVPKVLESKDLLAEGRILFLVSADVTRSFRQRLGDRFLYYRHQVLGLTSLQDAQKKTSVDPKTIRAIEGGSGNPRFSSFEEYATGLDVDLEQIVREASAPARADSERSPEAERIASLFDELKSAESRRVLMSMAEGFHAAEPLMLQESEPRHRSTEPKAAIGDEARERTSKPKRSKQ